MGEEESTSGGMRISIGVGPLVVTAVVTGPFDDIILI